MSGRAVKQRAWLALVLALTAAAGCTSGPLDVARMIPRSLERDLVAHWDFDDGTGSVLADSSGYQRDGAVTGATWTADGAFGSGALHFVPGQDVQVPRFPAAMESFTVSLWVRMTAAEMVGGYVTLVSTEVPFTGGWEVNVIFAGTDPPGEARYHFGYYVGPSQSDYDYAECACLVADSWVHLAAVVDGPARALSFYVNASLKQRVAIRGFISAGSPTLYMARWSQVDPARLLTGALDDVAIWNRALAPEEIALLHSAPAPKIQQ